MKTVWKKSRERWMKNALFRYRIILWVWKISYRTSGRKFFITKGPYTCGLILLDWYIWSCTFSFDPRPSCLTGKTVHFRLWPLILTQKSVHFVNVLFSIGDGHMVKFGAVAIMIKNQIIWTRNYAHMWINAFCTHWLKTGNRLYNFISKYMWQKSFQKTVCWNSLCPRNTRVLTTFIVNDWIFKKCLRFILHILHFKKTKTYWNCSFINWKVNSIIYFNYGRYHKIKHLACERDFHVHENLRIKHEGLSQILRSSKTHE